MLEFDNILAIAPGEDFQDYIARLERAFRKCSEGGLTVPEQFRIHRFFRGSTLSAQAQAAIISAAGGAGDWKKVSDAVVMLYPTRAGVAAASPGRHALPGKRERRRSAAVEEATHGARSVGRRRVVAVL